MEVIYIDSLFFLNLGVDYLLCLAAARICGLYLRRRRYVLAALLGAEVLCCAERLDEQVHAACGSDMMSDVLAYVKDQAILLTGLVNPQVIRTAMMMDMHCVVFVRNKKPPAEIVELARDNGIVVLRSACRMYEACGRLYASGLGTEESAL